MAYSEKAYYYETEINGWRWRVEYFPYNLTEGNANRISATYEPTWEQFDTDILFDITSNCESKYSDILPIGYPTARSIKFTLDIAQMSSEAVESIRQLNRSNYSYPELSSQSSFEKLNLWILRTDYGNTATNYTISGVAGNIPSAPAYFVGLQKLAPTTESEIILVRGESGNEVFSSLYELECVDAIFEFNRQCKIEWLGDSLMQADPDASAMRIYRGSIYDFVKDTKVRVQVGSTWVWDDGLFSFRENDPPLNNVICSWSDIRTIYNKYLTDYLRSMRLQQNRFTISSEGFLHYEFVRFFLNPANTMQTGADITSDDDLYFVIGTAIDNGGGSYSRTYGGLFEKGDKTGQLFEGETINDMCQNLALTFGHKATYRIRGGNSLVNSTTGILQAYSHDDGIAYNRDTITIKDDAKASITIGTGDNAGVVRSFIYNVDNYPQDRNVTTYKSNTFGNQSENDFEKKCIVHNLPRLDKVKIENDLALDSSVRASARIENSLYLRRILSLTDINGTLLSPDPCRVHEFCKFAVKRDYSFPNNPTWVNDEFDYTPLHATLYDFGSTYEEQIANYCNHVQLNVGLSNIITQTFADVFIAKNMFLLTIEVDMTDKRNSNLIGEMYNLIFPAGSMFEDYDNTRACLVEVSDDIMQGVCKMKLLGVID